MEVKAGRPQRPLTVDTDVHHGYQSRAVLAPYLSRYYAERWVEYGFGIDATWAFNGGSNGRRIDLVGSSPPPPAAGAAAYDIDDTRRRLLDEAGVDIALLTGGPGQLASAMMDVDYAGAICKAFNDYSLEHWIASDDRFRLALHVCSQDPVAAAAEIDRLGSHPAVCAVMLGCGAPKPYGQRFYYPIYEACERNSLAVAIHFGGEGAGINPSPSAAGFPSHYIEGRQLRPAFYAVHVASLVFEGVFEKFPGLKVALLEGGFAWLAPLMWKMDADWKGLRRQTPWVRRLPSSYVKEHIRLATQPMEEPDNPEWLKHILEWIDGANTLMFSSDYPHWDWDSPQTTFAGYPEETRRKIFSQNAIDTFRLKIPHEIRSAG